MSGLVPADRMWVKFHGRRGGDGPMTLGQHNTAQWMGFLPPGHFLTMTDWIFEVPKTAGLDDVLAAWGVLFSRHESLRTTYPPERGPDGWPVQRITASGEAVIDVYEIDGDDMAPPAVARALIAVLRERPFQWDWELPVRLAVAVAADGIRSMVAVFSHMAVDLGSVAVLGRQFTELAGDPASRVLGPLGYQPLEQAEAERSPRGRKRAQASLRFWREHLARGPQCTFAVPEQEPEPDGPDLPPACALYSPAAALALPDAARRAGVSPSVVTLAAIMAVFTHRTGNPDFMIVTTSGNRVGAWMHDYVGTAAQYGLIATGAGSATTFSEYARQVGGASLRANRHSMFNADELEVICREADRDRGISYQQETAFNNICAWGVHPRKGGQIPLAGDAAGSTPTSCEPAGMLEWSTPRWTPVGVHVVLLAVEPALELSLVTGDTRRVPAAELGRLLEGIERLLVAAGKGDVALADLTRVTGVEPVTRGPGWLYIDSCWIELPACQQLVQDALPGAGARVFAIPGPDGTTELTAYLTATQDVRTAGDAHAACTRTLPGRRTAMSPGRYVVCASAPADPCDLAGWRRQPVLCDASGRPARDR